MIGSLLPSVFSNGSFGVQDNGGDDAPAVRDAAPASLTQLRGVEDTGSDGGVRDGRNEFAHGRHDFVHQAKHMIRDALKTFSHDLRDSFHELGFQSDMVMRLAQDVMYAAKKALKSGADFTANLMMAAVSQTTMTGAAGTSSSFEMVASEIEITVNHSTGSVEINATQVEIQAQMASGGAAAPPQLVDFMDTDGTDAAPLLAMNDLDSILANEAEEGETETLGPVLAGLPEDEPEAADETDPAAGAEVAATEEGETAPAGEDGEVIPTPQLTGVSHIVITAFQRYLNAEDEQITYIKFDAVIPLTSSSSDTPTVVETVAEDLAQQTADATEIPIVDPTEVPVVEQVIEEPVGQPATTDLVA